MNAVRRAILTRADLARDASTGPREYELGTDARSIDWRASARTGVLQTRERQPERVAWCAVIDCSESMSAGTRRSLSAAAREARRFWNGCMEGPDHWFDISTGARSFDMHVALVRALQLLPRNAAVLVVSDFYDLTPEVCALLPLLARRFDCTALLARDPWHAGLPLHGFVRVTDIESGTQQILYIGKCERARYREATLERHTAILRLLETAHWRAATLDECDGRTAVRRAFHLA